MGYSCNTDTFAMSEYPDAPFRCPACIDGKLYAVTDGGIVALDAEHDEGKPFDSAIEWDLIDFDSDLLKRPHYAYVAYKSTDVLFMRVGYVAKGYEEQTIQELPQRIADDVVPGRFRIGRGIRSRHFRVGFQAAPGYAFTLYDASMTIDTTRRRI